MRARAVLPLFLLALSAATLAGQQVPNDNPAYQKLRNPELGGGFAVQKWCSSARKRS